MTEKQKEIILPLMFCSVKKEKRSGRNGNNRIWKREEKEYLPLMFYSVKNKKACKGEKQREKEWESKREK